MSANKKTCRSCGFRDDRPTYFRVVGQHAHYKKYSPICMACEERGVIPESFEGMPEWKMEHIAQEPGFNAEEWLDAIGEMVYNDCIPVPQYPPRKVDDVPDMPRSYVVALLRAANRERGSDLKGE